MTASVDFYAKITTLFQHYLDFVHENAEEYGSEFEDVFWETFWNQISKDACFSHYHHFDDLPKPIDVSDMIVEKNAMFPKKDMFVFEEMDNTFFVWANSENQALNMFDAVFSKATKAANRHVFRSVEITQEETPNVLKISNLVSQPNTLTHNLHIEIEIPSREFIEDPQKTINDIEKQAIHEIRRACEELRRIKR